MSQATIIGQAMTSSLVLELLVVADSARIAPICCRILTSKVEDAGSQISVAPAAFGGGAQSISRASPLALLSQHLAPEVRDLAPSLSRWRAQTIAQRVGGLECFVEIAPREQALDVRELSLIAANVELGALGRRNAGVGELR